MRIIDILDDHSDYEDEKKASTLRLIFQFFPKFPFKTTNKKKSSDLEFDQLGKTAELQSEMETTFEGIKREILEKYEAANNHISTFAYYNENSSRRRHGAESEIGCLQQKLEAKSVDDTVLVEISSEEEEFTQDDSYERVNGVSAYELERRLQDLIKRRRKEQIEELEKALE